MNTILDIDELIRSVTTDYANFSLTAVNDHTVKLSVMTEPYFWHYHPDSDETFMVIDGILVIELETQTLELSPGQLFTVPKNTVHRTRPKGKRSVNLTVEHAQIKTINVEKL